MSNTVAVWARVEAALAPSLIPTPEPAKRHTDKNGKEYWQSGFVSALTEDTCNSEAIRSARSALNLDRKYFKIPWC